MRVSNIIFLIFVSRVRRDDHDGQTYKWIRKNLCRNDSRAFQDVSNVLIFCKSSKQIKRRVVKKDIAMKRKYVNLGALIPQQETKESSLSRLPSELLSQIVHNLGPYELLAFALTNRQQKKVFDSEFPRYLNEHYGKATPIDEKMCLFGTNDAKQCGVMQQFEYGGKDYDCQSTCLKYIFKWKLPWVNALCRSIVDDTTIHLNCQIASIKQLEFEVTGKVRSLELKVRLKELTRSERTQLPKEFQSFKHGIDVGRQFEPHHSGRYYFSARRIERKTIWRLKGPLGKPLNYLLENGRNWSKVQ